MNMINEKTSAGQKYTGGPHFSLIFLLEISQVFHEEGKRNKKNIVIPLKKIPIGRSVF